jgi:Flp pilus assembly protein CpaB
MEMEFKDTSRRRTFVLVLGVLLAVAAGGAAFMLSSQGTNDPVALPMRQVVVAADNIPFRTVITADQVTLRLVQDDITNASAFTDPLQVVGRTTAVAIFQYQPLTPNLLTSATSGGSLSILQPTETISPTSPVWRAASISVPAERAVAGYVTEGQRVDLFVTLPVPVPAPEEGQAEEEGGTPGEPAQAAQPASFYADSATKLLYTDLEILASPPESGVYILKVDAHQAEELAHLQNLGAQFTFTLRPEGDNREIDRSSYGETTNRILTQYNFPLPEVLQVDAYPQPAPFPTPYPNVPYLSPPPSEAPGTSPTPEASPGA